MKKIQFGRRLALPADAVTQTFGFIARKGGGKTYAAGVLVEGMLDIGAQVVVIDPVGNWYGLRLAADGKGKGYEIPIFGGEHGDVPLGHGRILPVDRPVEADRAAMPAASSDARGLPGFDATRLRR